MSKYGDRYEPCDTCKYKRADGCCSQRVPCLGFRLWFHDVWREIQEAADRLREGK